MHRRLLFALLIVASGSLVQANSAAVPECIFDLCLRGTMSNLLTEEQVKKMIGSNREAKPSVPHRRSSCHVISTPKHKEVYANLTYIKLESKWRLIATTIASLRLCNNPEKLSVNYELLTEKGIGLGARKRDIIAAYGKPTYLLQSPSMDLIGSYFPDATERDSYTIIQYVRGGDDSLVARLFLLRSVVVGINISADE